jgi:hypothetical protein
MTIMSKQSGLAPIIIISVIAIIALAGGGYAFLQSKGTSSNPLSNVANSVVNKVTLNPNCKENDPELCKFLNNWKEMKEYSVISVSTDKSGKKSESTLEISGEEKFHMMLSADGKEVSNLITIGDITYTKDYSDNKWWKQKAEKQKEDSLTTQFDFDDSKSETPKTEVKTTYKAAGKEACGSLQCFKYQVIEGNMDGATEYIFFDDKEYLLRRMQTIEKDGIMNDSMFAYSGVKITEPSPVKEAKADQLIVPGMGAEDAKQLEQYKKDAEKMLLDAQRDVPQDNTDTTYSEEN